MLPKKPNFKTQKPLIRSKLKKSKSIHISPCTNYLMTSSKWPPKESFGIRKYFKPNVEKPQPNEHAGEILLANTKINFYREDNTNSSAQISSILSVIINFGIIKKYFTSMFNWLWFHHVWFKILSYTKAFFWRPFWWRHQVACTGGYMNTFWLF